MLQFHRTELAKEHGWSLFDVVGYIPQGLSEDDDRDAVTQLDASYQHGGGWRDFPGSKLREDKDLSYPGDPITRRLAYATLRDEQIYVYEHAWVVVEQPDGSFRCSRMD